jgi:NAD(P)H-hydrate epimerase
MENAGRGAADLLSALSPPGRVAICCGKGNNAGDGFVIARHLDFRGWDVQVVVWAEEGELRGDAAANFAILEKSGVEVCCCGDRYDPGQLDRLLAGANWIVAALWATGAAGEPRPPLDQVIDRLNAHATPKLAVDLPSGLDCDSGQAARHTIMAQHTATFVAAKPGFFVPGAERYLGTLHVLEIGVPRKLLDEVLAAQAAEGG